MYKVKDGVDVHVAVQVNACDNVNVNVNLNVLARTFRPWIDTSSPGGGARRLARRGRADQWSAYTNRTVLHAATGVPLSRYGS
jgi:hypothetical protein